MKLHHWAWPSFLHWRYRPADVQALLPRGLRVETFDGSAWVSLVPFRMRVRFPGAGSVLGVSTFPETNVRTYVVGPDGGTGIWFFSLEAARIVPVLVARAGLRLPYMWARMAIERSGDAIHYASRRTWPGPAGARADVQVGIGEPIAVEELDDFLVSRSVCTRAWSRGRWRGSTPSIFPGRSAAPRFECSTRTWSRRAGCPYPPASRWSTSPKGFASGSAGPPRPGEAARYCGAVSASATAAAMCDRCVRPWGKFPSMILRFRSNSSE